MTSDREVAVTFVLVSNLYEAISRCSSKLRYGRRLVNGATVVVLWVLFCFAVLIDIDWERGEQWVSVVWVI